MNTFTISPTMKMSSANATGFGKAKILSSGKELTDGSISTKGKCLSKI